MDLSEPALTAPRHQVLMDNHAPVPAMALGWRLPDPATETDRYVAAMVLAGVLAGGNGARLTERLTRHERLVNHVWAHAGLGGAPFVARSPDALVVNAILPPGGSVPAVVDAVDAELTRLADTGPTAAELAGCAGRLAVTLYRELDDLEHRTCNWALSSCCMAAPNSPPSFRPGAAGRRRRGGRSAPRCSPSIAQFWKCRPRRAPMTAISLLLGRTSVGPRPLPPLAAASPVLLPQTAERTTGSGLRVICARRPGVPLVELRLRIPFGAGLADHCAAAEVLAAALFGAAGAAPAAPNSAAARASAAAQWSARPAPTGSAAAAQPAAPRGGGRTAPAGPSRWSTRRSRK